MKQTILVIEDNSDVRDNIVEILELSGYKVIEAENGKVGVQKAQAELPDLILCDIMMPVMDGYGVLYILSKNKETSSIPFIFLTAKADAKEVREGMIKGADDYITKPFEELELLQAIEVRMERKSKLAEAQSQEPIQQLNSLIDLSADISALDKEIANSKVQSYSKKETIYHEGNNPIYVYQVQHGKVKQFKSNLDGKDLITNIAGPGEFFGYTAVLRDTVYEESAMAMEDTSCKLISKEDFIKLISVNPSVSGAMVKLLANRVTEDQDELLSLAYNSVRKRVANGLLKLAENYDKGLEGGYFPAYREDLANIVGTASESVIRVLAEFKEDKLIKIEGRQISILDADKLAHLPY